MKTILAILILGAGRQERPVESEHGDGGPDGFQGRGRAGEHHRDSPAWPRARVPGVIQGWGSVATGLPVHRVVASPGEDDLPRDCLAEVAVGEVIDTGHGADLANPLYDDAHPLGQAPDRDPMLSHQGGQVERTGSHVGRHGNEFRKIFHEIE